MKVKIIYGSPCSGKSTHVQNHAGDNDLIYDYDRILQACTTRKKHTTDEHPGHIPVVRLRFSLLNAAAEVKSVACFWLICRWPNDAIRRAVSGMEVEEILVPAKKEDCYKRLMQDETRPDKEAWKAIIDEWFNEHGSQLGVEEEKSMKTDEIHKNFSGDPIRADSEKDIALINKYTLRELTPEEIFAFNANLCDSQVDRDLEAFSVLSLKKLQALFVGKPLITDHHWSAGNQAGRVYKTQLVKDGGVTRLRASIYMIRTSRTEETIKQIEAGILREVSIGVSVKRTVCSVCGEDLSYDYTDGKRKCSKGHIVGEKVGGQVVHGILEDPVDAYEVSLVAVPAQMEAGITKRHSVAFAISPEESAKRKRILEKASGVEISDEEWLHILSGEVPARVLVEAKSRKIIDGVEQLPDDPQESHESGAIQFALLPIGSVDPELHEACLLALAHVRKELDLPKLTINYFVPLEEIWDYSRHPSTVKTFEHIPTLEGTIDKTATDRIYVRVLTNKYEMQRVVIHEAMHIWQKTKFYFRGKDQDEESAYRYEAESFRRLCALNERDSDNLLLSEL